MSMLVQHHTKYKEIHGEDEIVMMTPSEHVRLHKRLRSKGQCTVPVDELTKISRAAHRRTEKGKQSRAANNATYRKSEHGKEVLATYLAAYSIKNIRSIDFFDPLDTRINLHESIRFNAKTGGVYVVCRFQNNGRDMIYIDI